MTIQKPLHKILYVQVLAAIALGVVFGAVFPSVATADWVKALGDGFVKLIKMAIAPIIFCTVSSGIAHIEDARKVGRVGLKALVYFEVVSTVALAIGLLVGIVLKPGAGFPGKADPAAAAGYIEKAAHSRGVVESLLHIIPDNVVLAFADGEIVQVLFFAILFGFSLLGLKERGAALRSFVDDLGHAMFGVIGLVMHVAPIGAFGAMAYTVGKYGLGALISLGWLVGAFYATSIIFIGLCLGLIARLAGFNIFSFLFFLKDELLIVLGTSSSESALPRLMQKLELIGCAPSIVKLVVPTGYSFNLDGTNIYMTLATIFIAQALGVDLSPEQELTIIGVAMLTSKGASGVTGAGFVTLAATLASVDPRLLPGMALLLGVDKFMSECRALTNFCGNGVATVVIASWEGGLDRAKLEKNLGRNDLD
jgi:aerobic C4-dicarboxylate transport protein